MGRHYLSYWKPSASLKTDEDGRLFHSASDQFGKVRPGDVVWIVSVKAGELLLLARLPVALLCSQTRAQRILKRRSLWEAEHHIITGATLREARKHASEVKRVRLTKIAWRLRFMSATSPKLDLTGGTVRAQQLQAIRTLDPDSAALLESTWAAATDSSVEQPLARAAPRKSRRSIGAGFGDSETNREIERAAVLAVTQRFRTAGWTVRSVEREGCGYDLHCTRKKERLHVEVKGIRGTRMEFLMTAGEWRRSQSDARWRLWVVGNALSRKPVLNEYDGRSLAERFDRDPVAFRLKRRQAR